MKRVKGIWNDKGLYFCNLQLPTNNICQATYSVQFAYLRLRALLPLLSH